MHRLIAVAMSLFMGATAFGQDLSADLTVRSWGEFASGFLTRSGPNCPMVNMELQYRLDNNQFPEKRISRDDLEQIIGRPADYVAVEGGRFFYSLNTERYGEINHAYAEMQGFDTRDPTMLQDPARFMAFQEVMQAFTPEQLPSDIPVLCGLGETERTMKEQARAQNRRLDAQAREREARMKAEREAYLANCEVCRFGGGALLQAIFDGDYDKQHRIAGQYLAGLAAGGGVEAIGIGSMVGSLSGAGDLSVIEEMIGAYMLSASRNWGGQCFGDGSFRRKFTTEYKGASYETLGGVYMGSDPDVVKTTHYHVRGKFRAACDRLCNRNGALLLTAQMVRAGGHGEGAAQIFRGVDELIKSEPCNGPVMTQFEDNLLAMWAREKTAPASEPRNTLRNALQ